MTDLEESYVPKHYTFDQQQLINSELNLPYPELSSTPIDEFNSEGYISCAFPVLFPFGSNLIYYSIISYYYIILSIYY